MDSRAVIGLLEACIEYTIYTGLPMDSRAVIGLLVACIEYTMDPGFLVSSSSNSPFSQPKYDI